MASRRQNRNRFRSPAPPRTRISRRQLLRLLAYLFLSLLLLSAGYWLVMLKSAPVEIKPDPIRTEQVMLTGTLHHVSPLEIETMIRQHGELGMLALDSEALRIDLEAIPWVYLASVRKMWKGHRLMLRIEEQQAAVRWGEAGYLNPAGEFFSAAGETLSGEQLVMIRSSQRDTESIYQLLLRLQQMMAQRQSGSEIAEMSIDRRGAVTLLLQDHFQIRLGRRSVERRLQRWIDQSPRLLARYEGEVSGVDLRYLHGMVLHPAKASSATTAAREEEE